MSKQPGLLERGNRYYFRAKVPLDLIEHFEKREVKRALGTSDYQRACRLVHQEWVKWHKEIEEARRKLTCAPVTSLSEPEIEGLARSWYRKHKAEAERRARASDHEPGELEEILLSLDIECSELRQANHPNTLVSVQADVDRLLAEQEIDLTNNPGTYWLLYEYVRRASIQVNRDVRNHYDGVFGRPPEDCLFAEKREIETSQPLAPPSGLTLRELIARYQSDPGRTGLSAKTATDYAIIFRLLGEVLGDERDVSQISREDCRRLRDLLMAIPPNASKRFPGLTLEQAAKRAMEDGLPTLSITSINKHLNALSALFNYAVREDYIQKSPATGLAISQRGVPTASAIKPFSTEQLNLIFRAPLYTGCKDDENGYAIKGPNQPRRGRFWVPLLALWTGTRLNECCQLETDDVEMVDGCDAINIRTEGRGDKRLKTDSATRVIPVHSELGRIGFLDYVARQRNTGSTHLFPELTLGRSGYYSDPFSKWFGRFLIKCGISERGCSFHSFRHTWRDATREAGLSKDVVLALGGWKSSTVEESYGKGLRVPST